MYNIYLIINLQNNKKYVGQTINSVEKRWNQHVRRARAGGSELFMKAIRKYGENSFKIERLSLAKNKFIADVIEKFWIGKLQSKILGYNLTDGGEGFCGQAKSEAHKQKLSKALIGRKRPIELVQKTADKLKGHTVSLETRLKISKSKIGKPRNKAIRDAISKAKKRKALD